jgi:hypothetical protein
MLVLKHFSVPCRVVSAWDTEGLQHELEFLDINLKKDSSFSLNVIHSPFLDYIENHTLLWL